MKNERRLFINQLSLLTGITVLSKPISSVASISRQINTFYANKHAITIYHTNDLHGNLASSTSSAGGLSQIKTLLKDQEAGGLLLDAGDFLSSTHSFSRQAEVIRTMNSMGYHAAAIGNQELANGEDQLAALIPLMRFKLVNCNYEFSGALKNLVKPYVVIHSGKFKIGITGVGHQLDRVGYNDPVGCANNIARILKEQEKCDLVICLSHLGYSREGSVADSQKLANASENIDLIVSGHNRKVLKGQMVVWNKNRHEVIIAQTAWNGLMMGRTIFGFNSAGQKSGLKARYFMPGKPNGAMCTTLLNNLRLEQSASA